MIVSVTNKPRWKHSCLAKSLSLLRYSPLKSFVVFNVSSLFLYPVLLSWLVKKCSFHLISHRTLSPSVLGRKFPACVAPSWCYFQGMAFCLQQIVDLDGFFSVFSRDCLEEMLKMQLAHGDLVTSCAHRHRFTYRGHLRSRLYSVAEKNMRKILEVFVVFVLTCLRSVMILNALTWLLNGAAAGRSKDQTRTAGEDHTYDDSD